MAKHEANKISAPLLEALLAGQGSPRTIGQLAWRIRGGGTYGKITAEIKLEGCTNGILNMAFRERAPYQPTFSYLVNNVAAYRVCVNKDTNRAKGSHGHKYIPATGEEHNHSLPGCFQMIENLQRPSNAQLRAAFEEFAGLVNVQLHEGYWIDPGEVTT
jgi:hypothetical protein